MTEMGVLTEADRTVFAAYCQAYARWRQNEEWLSTNETVMETSTGYRQQVPQVGMAHTYYRDMLSAMSELGLTPSTRSRIIAALGNKETVSDDMESLLSGGGK